MTAFTTQILAHLSLGPAHTKQLSAVLGINPKRVVNAANELIRRELVEKIGYEKVLGNDRPLSIYALVAAEDQDVTPDTSLIVASAIASRMPLERVWG